MEIASLYASAEVRTTALPGAQLQHRLHALLRRSRGLSSLRSTLGLGRGRDLSAHQWRDIEAELVVLSRRIVGNLTTAARRYLPRLHEHSAAVQLHERLGEIELELSEAYTYFDTFVDVLSQRLAPQIGPVLKGCDVLAKDGLAWGHPALALAGAPIVYLDRGFGAAILRSGRLVSRLGRTPVPLIQMPYARLLEKYNLASLIHEVGHEALVRLRLRRGLAQAIGERLARRTSSAVRDLFARWMSELGPDFWAFGCCGAAQAATMRDVLHLPRAHALTVAINGVHPPPFLRALASFSWCRRAFGRGAWDDWEAQWLEVIDPRLAAPVDRQLLREGRRLLPYLADVFFEARWPTLNGRPLADLFALGELAPARLRLHLGGATTESPAFLSLRPVHQLAVFRLVRECSSVSESKFDTAMTSWLTALSSRS